MSANNQFNITWDYPGLCVKCHVEVAEFNGSHQVSEGVFRPRISRWKGNMRTMMTVLDNGSQMMVVICDKCLRKFKPEDTTEVMESVINGWQKECSDFVKDWTEDQRLDYMTDQSKRHIKDVFGKPFKPVAYERIEKPREGKLDIIIRKDKK